MKLSTSGRARLVEKRSDERDNVGLTNAVRDVVNGQGQYFISYTTTDASLLTVWSDTMAPSSALMLWIDVVGQVDDLTCVVASRRSSFLCTSAGVATFVSTSVIGADDNPIGATFSAGVAGGGSNGVRLLLAGAAATTVQWRLSIRGIWTPFE